MLVENDFAYEQLSPRAFEQLAVALVEPVIGAGLEVYHGPALMGDVKPRGPARSTGRPPSLWNVRIPERRRAPSPRFGVGQREGPPFPRFGVTMTVPAARSMWMRPRVRRCWVYSAMAQGDPRPAAAERRGNLTRRYPVS